MERAWSQSDEPGFYDDYEPECTIDSPCPACRENEDDYKDAYEPF